MGICSRAYCVVDVSQNPCRKMFKVFLLLSGALRCELIFCGPPFLANLNVGMAIEGGGYSSMQAGEGSVADFKGCRLTPTPPHSLFLKTKAWCGRTIRGRPPHPLQAAKAHPSFTPRCTRRTKCARCVRGTGTRGGGIVMVAGVTPSRRVVAREAVADPRRFRESGGVGMGAEGPHPTPRPHQVSPD